MAVPQTFQDLLNLVSKAVDRDDIAPTYLDFINRAIHDIAELHSFDQMSATATFTLPAGQNQIVLPLDFKEFQSGRFPLYATIAPATVPEPIPVYLKEEMSRLQKHWMPKKYLIFTSDNVGYQIGFLPGISQSIDWDLLLYYYAFPVVITNPLLTSPMLAFYPNLILSRTLSLIFQSINDPAFEEQEKVFELEMQGFKTADSINRLPNPAS